MWVDCVSVNINKNTHSGERDPEEWKLTEPAFPAKENNQEKRISLEGQIMSKQKSNCKNRAIKPTDY
jgi:hypothetical protein